MLFSHQSIAFSKDCDLVFRIYWHACSSSSFPCLNEDESQSRILKKRVQFTTRKLTNINKNINKFFLSIYYDDIY